MENHPITTEGEAIFNHQDFLRAVQRIPPNIIFDMAKDGVICDMEIARIFKLMGVSNPQIQALQAHYHAIAKLVLDYAHRELGIAAPPSGLCQLSSAQSIIIMEGLVKRGLIQPYFEQANQGLNLPSANASRTPGLQA